MVKRIGFITFISLFLVIVLACGQQATPISETGKEVQEVKPVTEAAAKASWQDDWAKTVATAKKEGRLVVYTVHGTEFRIPVAKAFKEKFDIDIEWMAGRGADLLPKLTQERRAGLYLADIMISGVDTLKNLGAEGATDPLEPALLLPEVKDLKLWRDGELHFIDKEHHILAFYSRTGSTILINSEMVKPEELKSYRDLLDPKWKGKIVINDSTGTGAGVAMVTAMQILMGHDFLRELAKQEPVITRDQRQQIEWVARGRYPVLLGPEPPIMAEFRKVGAPLKHIIPVEGTWSGAGGGMIGLINKAAHPAAAKVFLNWFLSQEGQTVAVEGALEQSRRLDVTTEFIDPDRRLQAGVKYADGDSEFFVQKRDETRVISKEIFAAQLK